MKKCSFCDHENDEKAKFCSNCGRTFVVKEIRTKLGQTFEILGYIAIALGLFAFIFELVNMIIFSSPFMAYLTWLVKYLMLAGISLVYLYAHKLKDQTISLLMTFALIVHMTIFFVTLPYSAFFIDLSSLYFLVFLLLIAFLLTSIVLLFLNHDLHKRFLFFGPYIVVAVVGLYSVFALLQLFVYGFKDYGVTVIFGILSGLFYLLAITILFVLPIVDKEIDSFEKQGQVESEH